LDSSEGPVSLVFSAVCLVLSDVFSPSSEVFFSSFAISSVFFSIFFKYSGRVGYSEAIAIKSSLVFSSNKSIFFSSSEVRVDPNASFIILEIFP